MTIIANYTRHTALILLITSGFGLAACAPIPQAQPPMPQAYPMQPQAQQGRQYKYRAQPPAPIPRAAALQNNRVAAVRTVPARPVTQVQQHSVTRQAIPGVQVSARTTQAQVMVPPVLKPVRQQAQRQAIRPVNTTEATRYARPSASVSQPPVIVYREEKKPPQAVNRRKQQPAMKYSVRPGKSGRTAASRPRPATTRRVPAPAPQQIKRPSASVKAQQQPGASVKQKPVTEVLDMSNKTQRKPVASVKTAKKLPPLPPKRSYNNSPAVAILVKQANNELSVGKTGRAAATLERALRISPGNPVLWLRLAEVNEQQGNKAQAASMAKKAMGLAPGDENLKQRGQRLLN